MISTRDLHLLPPPPRLKCLSQSLALLDAALEPEWHLRYFSFNNEWDENKAMASMRTSDGDGYFIVFCAYGTLAIGHAPQSPFGQFLRQNENERQKLREGVPICFAPEMNEPAFEAGEADIFAWSVGNTLWEAALLQGVSYDDNSADLWFALDDNPATYVTWAGEYFERLPNPEAVRSVYAHAPLTKALANALNPEADYENLVSEATEIGYSVS